MMNFFRRKRFEAKPIGGTSEIEAGEPEPEQMMPRIEEAEVPVSYSMIELARQIAQNPAWADINRRIRQEQLKLLLSTGLHQSSIREECYRRLRALDDINMALDVMSRPEAKRRPQRFTSPNA